MENMKISGSCHCGRLTYEAVIDPEKVSMCHCADCQTFSGAPFRASAPVKAEDFTLTGEPKIYIKTADSGSKRAQAFCGECGSALYSTQAEAPSVFMLRLGGVTQRAQLPPKKQIWCDSALGWTSDLSAILGVAGQR
jgi:hypothetical protein